MSHKIPGVLSFQRGTILTDGLMYSIVPNKDGEEKIIPVKVIRHGIRGANSHPKKDSDLGLPQRTESAKTSTGAIGLAVHFHFKTIPANNLLFGCSDPEFRKMVEGFVDRFFRRGVLEFDEVCRRYARNILNGRWLWRNRILGETSVIVTAGNEKYVSSNINLRNFDDYTKAEQELASVIATGLLSPNHTSQSIKVEGRVMFGFAGEVEVFPSQNMAIKPKGFARSLYKVDMISRSDLLSILSSANKNNKSAGEFTADIIEMGKAALRDQKIGNAIRTIDTWYDDDDGNTPIAVEPNGANLDTNVIFRTKEKSANVLLGKLDTMIPNDKFNNDAAFLIAIMIRGGVFSEGK